MNDAPPAFPATAATPPGNELGQGVALDSERPLSARRLAKRQKKNRENFQRKRIDLLDDLLRNVDILIYAELSTVYYMDCRFFLFFARAFIQFYYLTPKPAMFARSTRTHASLGGIFGSNLLCILLHCLLTAPAAGEATRGYLHGGVIMDFIGQKGPSSILYLVLLDLFVLTLQIVHLSAYSLRQNLTASVDGVATVVSVANSTAASAGQTVEDEERGVRRSAEQGRVEDIEMQNLTSTGTISEPPAALATSSSSGIPQEEVDPTSLDASFQPRQTDAHIFDAFNSGQMVIADLDLERTVKDHILMARIKHPDDAERAESTRQMRQRLMQRLLARI